MRFSAVGFSKKRPGIRRSLTASAQIMTPLGLRQILNRFPWQKGAWDAYASVGELHYAINYLAMAGSRARLYVGTPAPNGVGPPTPDDDPQSAALLAELGDGESGHAELLMRLFTHLSVPGESYVIGYDDPVTGKRCWIAACGDELQQTGGKTRLRVGPSEYMLLDDALTTILRIHVEDAHYRWEPDSPVRSALPYLIRLQALSANILATCDSRLAGAGILLVPDSISPPAGSPGTEGEHEDWLINDLIDAMVTPISDRDSAAAVVPYVLRLPDEVLEKVKHLTFYTDFNKQVPELIELTLRQIAISLNMPAEILLGTPQNHWSAWQVSEDFVKLNVEPVLSIICQAFTAKYFQPSSAALGKPTGKVIWYDTTELVERPDKGAEAITMNAAGLISDEASRRENGFSEADAPSAEQKLQKILEALAKSPGAAAVVLPLLGLPVPDAVKEIAPAGADTPSPLGLPGAPPAPAGPRALPARPSVPGPQVPASQQERGAYLVACEATVLRALEVIGKRLRTRTARGEHPDTAAWEMHTVLPVQPSDVGKAMAGAFDLADILLPDPASRETVQGYIEHLITTGEAYDRAFLLYALARAGCL